MTAREQQALPEIPEPTIAVSRPIDGQLMRQFNEAATNQDVRDIKFAVRELQSIVRIQSAIIRQLSA